MKTISVILPTLNAGRTLERCLASIRAQEYPRELVEIVIADAGSTDDTLAIAERYGVGRIVPNPLRTGEAGKAAAITASTGELLALVDSDNIFDDVRYFAKADGMFDDETVQSAEPIAWTYDPSDTLVNRYCALLGMNDPVSLFLGNFNRYSHLTRTFTGMPVKIVRVTADAVVADFGAGQAPTFGANGFIIRRSALEGIDWEPYYFDIDVFQQAARAGRGRIAIIKTETRHLFCDNVQQFSRKQARRIRDYFHHAKGQRRTYDYTGVPRRRYAWFVLATLTVIPLLVQAAKGNRNKPDSAWWFHPAACWITLWEYGLGTVRSLFGTAEYDRSEWKQ